MRPVGIAQGAQILVGFRKIESMIFELQTVGRIMRMPEVKHYLNDNLNKAYIYTDSNPKWVKFEGEEDWINKNIIKSIIVTREDIYKPLKLRSYYRNRIDFGDITAVFYDSLEKFCAIILILKKGSLNLVLPIKIKNY